MKTTIVHIIAGLSIGMICYAIYLGVLASLWPVSSTPILQLTETPAERKAVVLDAFKDYHTEVWLGLSGLVFPFVFMLGGYFKARKSPSAALKRPFTLIGICIFGLLGFSIAEAAFSAIVPPFSYLTEFLGYCLFK